jgi:hypothetical protein
MTVLRACRLLCDFLDQRVVARLDAALSPKPNGNRGSHGDDLRHEKRGVDPASAMAWVKACRPSRLA